MIEINLLERVSGEGSTRARAVAWVTGWGWRGHVAATCIVGSLGYAAWSLSSLKAHEAEVSLRLSSAISDSVAAARKDSLVGSFLAGRDSLVQRLSTLESIHETQDDWHGVLEEILMVIGEGAWLTAIRAVDTDDETLLRIEVEGVAHGDGLRSEVGRRLRGSQYFTAVSEPPMEDPDLEGPQYDTWLPRHHFSFQMTYAATKPVSLAEGGSRSDGDHQTEPSLNKATPNR